jgi:hypothetical protein
VCCCGVDAELAECECSGLVRAQDVHA